MICAVINVHVLDEGASEFGFGKHAFHDLDKEGVITGLDVFVERFFLEHLGGSNALAAGIAGVAKIFAVGPFFTGQADFVGVDDDNVRATLYVGRVGGLVFAAEQKSNHRAKTSEHLVGGVDDYPFFFAALCVGRKGLVA